VSNVFYVAYMLAELRRRRGRTFLSALGLAVGVGLVVTVNALSTGLDRAQDEVLEPLTGVGTDMSVTRPITFLDSGGGPPLSEEERRQLEEENGGARFGLRNLGKPGSHFSRDDFVAATQLSFPASEVTRIGRIPGVEEAAGSLTLTALHVEGTVPDEPQLRGGFSSPAPAPGGGPRSIDVETRSVTGVDQRHEALGAITPGQVSKGRYFGTSEAREAILNVSYARREGLGVGDEISLGGKTFTVVGLAQTPLGGQASDVYVKLGQLQELSDREGRVNTVHVRAASGDSVADVARKIKSTLSGASVTTAEDLADRVSGSLVDAKNLTSRLGTALAIVGLLGAVLIATLLTLSSVAKRVRELGTLKAVGWRQRLVVRQVAGESLLQGLLGGALGIAVGIAGAAIVAWLAPSLEATVAEAADAAGPRFGPFGQGDVGTGSTTVDLDAPVSLGLVALAVALAVGGGLVAGAVGALRAARLRPADALRHID
jgi:ABC-type antimicrobial peptide transport system permease subunit